MPNDNFPDFQAEIARLAHQYYEEEGRPPASALQHWERAEQELRRRSGDLHAADDRPAKPDDLSPPQKAIQPK